MPALSAACITMLPSGTWTFLPSRSISSMSVFWSRSDVLRHDARLLFDVVDELVAEVLDHRAHRHRGRVAQCADRAALDVVGHRVQQVDVAHLSLPVLDAVDHAPRPAGALTARRALSAALVLVEVRQAQQ